MKMKLGALALVASLFTAPAFAAGANFGVAGLDVAAGPVDVVALTTTAITVDFAAITGTYIENVAMIQQAADFGFAVIDQTAATAGNFASIVQVLGAATPAVGYITQTGNGNLGYINQH